MRDVNPVIYEEANQLSQVRFHANALVKKSSMHLSWVIMFKLLW
jgi:hypothetical protein